MVDDKLALEEAQRAANYEAIKSNVKAEVAGDIYAEASRPVPSQAARVEEVAQSMRSTAVDEVIETKQEVERARTVARISQIVDYLFFLVYGLLTIRLLLALFAARENAGFFRLIKTVTDPFYAPFRGLVPSPSTARRVYPGTADCRSHSCLYAVASCDKRFASDLRTSKNGGLSFL